ncbi:MAG TPA: hypothetical protein VEC16_01590 [Alphaproteobacteria bacterium]|nr:hypothetical protein [Alphaproteobacteria bacterium]
MEIIKTIRDTGIEIENRIKIENGVYTHRQIEKVDGKVFMRFKSRKLFVNNPNYRKTIQSLR